MVGWRIVLVVHTSCKIVGWTAVLLFKTKVKWLFRRTIVPVVHDSSRMVVKTEDGRMDNTVVPVGHDC
jgi:hypothetical protein